jgi:LacI family transcriptional regulator
VVPDIDSLVSPVSTVVDNVIDVYSPDVTRHPRTTIRDVAERAGVSVATVSKVLNGRYGVSAATLAHVQAVIDELGYQSSIVASSLRSHRTNVVGILVADLEPFSTELLKGAARAVRDTPYELVVYSAGGRAADRVGWERRYLSRLGGTLIDGALLVTPTVIDAQVGFPVVAVDPHTGDSGVPIVASDNLHGARLATEHLLELGHRRIGFVAGRPDLESARLRRKGYELALTDAGIPVDLDLVVNGDFEQEPSREAARELLLRPQPPSAIFAANDLSALGVLAAATTLGLDVPADLSIVGFDSIPESVMAEPPLTTVEQSIQLMGRRAVDMLLALLAGAEVPQRLTLPTRLVLRRSTAAPRPTAPPSDTHLVPAESESRR